MQNVLLYPHSADIDDEKLMRAIDQFAVNLDLWKADKSLLNVVSKNRGF
jgi:phosphoglycerate dehydrogenase-like enzyme